MNNLPKKLYNKLETRKSNNALRKLSFKNELVDFSSNDYLGFSKSKNLFNKTHDFLVNQNLIQNGATGSRLLSGNYPLYNTLETLICNFHKSESALIFNSGYDANIGFFSSVPQRGDVILYDEYIHASIRDGIKLSNANAYKFSHNNLNSLSELLERIQNDEKQLINKPVIYVVTESVFSMDGDSPNLKALSDLCKKYGSYLVVDEAHAIGVFGESGQGIIQSLNLEKHVFARLITYGKAMGCHGAAILGSNMLKEYLINFARSFIYTTALPPHALASIHSSYNELTRLSTLSSLLDNVVKKLHQNIAFFKQEIINKKLENLFIESDSSIHSCVISGNKKTKSIALKIEKSGFDVKPILSPTVPKGKERLRFCLHSYNSKKELSEVLELLANFIH